MIIEIMQFLSLIIYHYWHVLVFFFIFYVILPTVMVKSLSRRYKPYKSDVKKKATVIVPVHLEDYNLFENCIKSIAANRPDQIIISIDSNDEKLIEIAKKYGAEIRAHPSQVMKRRALGSAWEMARNEYIVQVDSDVILAPNCIEELLKPFDDPEVVGVASAHSALRTGSGFAYHLSMTIEGNRIIRDKAMNGGLVVVDGRCNAWRKGYLINVKQIFLNDIWLGIKSEIGDDRILTREAHKRNLKTVIQVTAKCTVAAPPTLNEYVRQQLRWRRSGTKFWLKDTNEGVHPSFAYWYHCFTYYTGPFILIAAIVLDFLFFPLPSALKIWNIWMVPLITLVGITLVTAFRQIIYYGRPISFAYLIPQALLSNLVMIPMSWYAALTIRRQHLWVTRNGNNHNNRLMIALAITGAIVLFSVNPILTIALGCRPPHYD